MKDKTKDCERVFNKDNNSPEWIMHGYQGFYHMANDVTLIKEHFNILLVIKVYTKILAKEEKKEWMLIQYTLQSNSGTSLYKKN